MKTGSEGRERKKEKRRKRDKKSVGNESGRRRGEGERKSHQESWERNRKTE